MPFPAPRSLAPRVDPAAEHAPPIQGRKIDPAALGIADLRKDFGPGRSVLDGVSLTVRPGEAVSVIGPNGAGKSTLLRCCLRLTEPTAGRILLLDCDVTAAGHRQLRRLRARVGFVFQRHNLVPRLSVLSNVIHGAQARYAGPPLWLQSMASRRIREEAMACLDRVGLADQAGQRVDHLSGGQSQRAAIARTLMQRPRFVIADEPVASLDPSAGEEVMRLFVELMRSDGTTLIFTTHNLDHACAYAERIVALRRGRLVLDAPTRDVGQATLRDLFDAAAQRPFG